MLLQNASLSLFSRQIGIHIENLFGMEELEPCGQVGIAEILELREELLRELLSSHQHLPDLAHHSLEELEIALFMRNDALPVPLIDISGVIVVEEVILAHGAHVGADAFADFASELS